MRDGRDENVWIDESGRRWIRDENGRLRVPEYSEPVEDESGFKTFETDRGHCDFCGALTCRGGCFR